MVDIDPGLLQTWMSSGQLTVPAHDVYLTIGETVGTPASTLPDCGFAWHHLRPPICLDLWPYVHEPRSEAFTTVAGWWSGKWVRTRQDGTETLYENTKRVSFLQFVELPRKTPQALELALYLADSDAEDRRLLETNGWRVRHSREVARTPGMYRSYIQRSRGEFSCAKPSCMKLRNGWISDRTLCYLASGKPAVVQDTGPWSWLPHGEGLLRFSTMAEAVEALAAVNAAYARHCRAARAIAEAYFDARDVAETILGVALGSGARVPRTDRRTAVTSQRSPRRQVSSKALLEELGETPASRPRGGAHLGYLFVRFQKPHRIVPRKGRPNATAAPLPPRPVPRRSGVGRPQPLGDAERTVRPRRMGAR
jgi:hypothetical protein